MPRDPEGDAERRTDDLLASLQRGVRILTWECAALLALTGLLVFLTFCR